MIKPFGLLSNKQHNAVVILSIVREMLSANKPELFRYNRKLDIVLNNGCRVFTAGMSSALNCLRGRSIDVMILDNFNVYKNVDVEEFYKCYIPVLGSMTNAMLGFVLNTQEKISKNSMIYIYSVHKK
jgi:hypothetical protein